MTTPGRFARRAIAVGAVSALGLGGLLVASPAIANDAAAPELDGAAVATIAQELVSENDAIQGAAIDADGNLVVVAVADTEDERAAVVASVEADGQADPANIMYLDAPFESAAATDVVGGAGYLALNTTTLQGGLCSVGFSAWSPSGDDAIITAGHCQDDGFNAIGLTVPTGDTAGGGAANGDDVTVYAPLGTFGFAQFGGPGDTAGSEGALDSIDIAVIDVTNAALNLKPAVTNWQNTADLSASASNITAVGSAVAGQAASKSGRTTGVTSGTVDLVNGSINVSGHFVHGFAVVGAQTIPGDSGGAVYSGSTALGITSATATLNGTPMTWASDLTNALPFTGGYTVKLFVAAPVVTTVAGADIERGANVTGTGPASTTIVVTPTSGAPFEVQTNAAGAWSFPAPSTLGGYDFTVQAKRGFDTSDVVSSSVNVIPAPLLAPVISTPANGAKLTSDVTTLTGTGLPGATVTVAGDASGTATVAANGTFTVTLSAPLALGAHTLTVSQSSEGQTSPSATTAFSVVPVSPAVTSPAPGSSFEIADAPTSVSGTGVDGATVIVSIDGVVIGETTVVGGVWTLEISPALTAGTHTVTATQAVDGVTSVAVNSTFTVNAAAVVTPPAEPGGNTGSGLANTGVESFGLIGGAAALLMAGAVVLVMRRRSITE